MSKGRTLARAAHPPHAAGGPHSDGARPELESRAANETIRCRAPRKPPRFTDDFCRGFVADAPAGSAVIRILEHSREKRWDTLVCSCGRCGALHEIALPRGGV